MELMEIRKDYFEVLYRYMYVTCVHTCTYMVCRCSLGVSSEAVTS